MLIDLGLLYERSDARRTEADAITSIAASMAEVGLINPIRVRACRRFHMGQERDAFEVIAGNHRFKAAKKLQWLQMEAIVVTDDDLHAELVMIDENLCRADLSIAERAKQVSRRKEIYEAIHPETRHGGDKASRKLCDLKSADRFTADTSVTTGRSERVVQLDAERGEKIAGSVLDMLLGTKLDTGAYLDKIKNLAPDEQVKRVSDDLAARKPTGSGRGDGSARIDRDVADRAANALAEFIVSACDPAQIEAHTANAFACGAKRLGVALVNLTGGSVMDRRYAA